MTMAPELAEPCAAALLLALVPSPGKRTNTATSEPITTKMPMEVAKINFFFFISAYSF